MLGIPLNFTVSITQNGKSEQINHFSQYINHQLIIKSDQIPLDQLAGLTYDPVSQKFVPVPIKAEWKDGLLYVSLYKKGNSIYTKGASWLNMMRYSNSNTSNSLFIRYALSRRVAF